MLTKFLAPVLVPKTKRNWKVTDMGFQVSAAGRGTKSVSSGIGETWDPESQHHWYMTSVT